MLLKCNKSPNHQVSINYPTDPKDQLFAREGNAQESYRQANAAIPTFKKQ